MTPHRVHLLEMRASRPGATAGDQLRAISAAIDLYAIEPDLPPADATARHLAEMRAGREVRRG